jgi:hypothetical protein
MSLTARSWAGSARRGCRAQSEVDPGRLRLSEPGLRAALLDLGGGVAELVIVDPGAGEVRLLPRGDASSSRRCWWTRSSINAGSITQMPAAKSEPRSCAKACHCAAACRHRSAAHADVAGLHRPGLLAGRVVQVRLDGGFCATQPAGDLRDREVLLVAVVASNRCSPPPLTHTVNP